MSNSEFIFKPSPSFRLIRFLERAYKSDAATLVGAFVRGLATGVVMGVWGNSGYSEKVETLFGVGAYMATYYKADSKMREDNAIPEGQKIAPIKRATVCAALFTGSGIGYFCVKASHLHLTR